MKLFVWDFHGVLERDNDLAVLDISNQVLAQQGHPERFSEEQNKEYYGLKWFQYFEQLLPDLSTEEHMALQAACFQFSEENLDIIARHIKPNDHAAEVLTAIQEAGHDQVLLSNTRPSDLQWFTGAVGLQEYFPEANVFGVNAHEEHNAKGDALRSYIEGKEFADLVIIGDSIGDMALKEVSGGVTYFYSHPHLELTQAAQSDYVITDLRDVLNEI